MTKSKKRSKTRQKFDFGMEKFKKQNGMEEQEWKNKKKNNTSSHMLLDHCYAFGLLL